PAIDPERRRDIILEIGRRLASIKNIIGRNVEKRDLKPPRCCGEPFSAVAVECKRTLRLGFGPIDGRIPPGIHDRPRQRSIHNSIDRARILQIKFWSANSNNRQPSLLCNVDKTPRQLASLPGYQDRAHSTTSS